MSIRAALSKLGSRSTPAAAAAAGGSRSLDPISLRELLLLGSDDPQSAAALGVANAVPVVSGGAGGGAAGAVGSEAAPLSLLGAIPWHWTPFPFVLSPSDLVILLASQGLFSRAAHLFWCEVIARPRQLFSPSFATHVFIAHLKSARKIKILQLGRASATPTDAESSLLGPKGDSSWGWNHLEENCEKVLCLIVSKY